MTTRLVPVAHATMLACALLVGSAHAQDSGKPKLKALDDAELSGVYGQALLDLTNTSQGGYDFSRITLGADITMSSTLSGLVLGRHADGSTDIDISTLSFGRSDLDDAHRTVAIANPYFEWVYSGTGADRQVVGMRVGFGGISGDVGLLMNTVSGSLSINTPNGQMTSLGSQSTALTGCSGTCTLALNQIGGVTAGTADGASRDFFLSILKAAVTYPTTNATVGAPAPGSHAMQALQDDELSAVRGADGISFNLNNFSLTSSLTNPLKLTYASPNGSSLTLSGLDLSRTDDADQFADPYQLSIRPSPAGNEMIAIDFPLNVAGNQRWSLTADFSNCSAYTAGTCAAGANFLGGTLQVLDLTMKGGGLYVAPSQIANTEGIAFGLGTQLDIGSLSVYSRGRAADGTIDHGDVLAVTGIHLVDAGSGGVYMLADLDKHPGLINAATDATGSYLHLQIGWPTAANAVAAGALTIDNISFTTAGVNGAAATTTNLGSASIASMQINYLDIKFRTGQ